MKKSKILAYYLPAFHEIEENNRWYGKGFTEWDNNKNAKTLFKGHYQPREPLADNYYDLNNDDVMIWQAKLAKENGIDGFCFYHYWFGNGRKILEMPAEKLLGLKDIELDYCFAWCNEAWRKTWNDNIGDAELLIDQLYGGKEEWEAHYNYLREFFFDKRYIKKENKPVLLIYNINGIPNVEDMKKYYDGRLKEDGFDGLYIIQMIRGGNEKRNDIADSYVNFEPSYTFGTRDKYNRFSVWCLKRIIHSCVVRNRRLASIFLDKVNYDSFYKSLIKREMDDKGVYSAFNDWDNSPRKGIRSKFFSNATPSKFKKYFRILLERSYKENKDYIFLFAWNEWGEGGYLEPDKKWKYGYLNAVKECVRELEIK